MVVVLTFGLIVALCTSFMVKLTTGAIGMAQRAISTKKKVDQPKTTGKPLKIHMGDMSLEGAVGKNEKLEM